MASKTALKTNAQAQAWGDLIRRKRTSKPHELTQTELAEELDTSQGTVGGWESSRAVPSAEMQARIIRFFGLTPREVYDLVMHGGDNEAA